MSLSKLCEIVKTGTAKQKCGLQSESDTTEQLNNSNNSASKNNFSNWLWMYPFSLCTQTGEESACNGQTGLIFMFEDPEREKRLPKFQKALGLRIWLTYGLGGVMQRVNGELHAHFLQLVVSN